MAEGWGSAFTTGGLVGQLAFLLLVLAMVTGRIERARAFVAGGAALGLLHALTVADNVVLAFWWGLLLLASLIGLIRRLVERQSVRFTPEEEAMRKSVFASLPRSRARHLLDQGFWLSGRAGDTLTREDEAVTHLFYLHQGEAHVMSHGRQVGSCRPGDLIGEVTVLTGDQASATVMLTGPARFWCAPATVLRPYVETHDDVRRALEQGFSNSLRAKLRAANERASEPANVAPAE